MRTLLSLVVLASGAFVLPSAASAAAPSCTVPSASAMSAYFDSSVGDRLAATKVPGAVVSVVAGGKTVFSRGYGTGMDPDRSLIRIASITKLFTWTAVLQQVQAGRLDLDADVNQYLTAFKIPATYPAPVTLRTLMNHTAGFEDQVVGTGARTAADVRPLAEYLADAMPDRIRPPGQVTAYSNYGAGLAGYIVSQVSGEPYDAYVQRHILDPLGMSHSTATEPVPASLAADLAHSYNTDETPVRTVPFEYDSMPPDGSISATASDMTRFASAYLSGSLVPPQYMQRSYATDARLSGGYAYGFMDRMLDGRRVLMHDGSWEAFGSILAMVPSCEVGIFLSANSTGSVDLMTPVLPGFLDLLGPGSDTAPTPLATSPLRPSTPVAGFYEPARRNESNFEKVLSLLGPSRLTIAADGTVHFRGKDFRPGAGGLYTATDGSDHLVFLASGDRRFVGTDGPALELLPFWRTPTFALGLLAFVALVAVTAPIAFFRRRKHSPGRRWRYARRATAFASLAGLAFLVLIPLRLFGDVRDFLYSVPLSFRLVLALPFLVGVLAIGGLAGTVTGWRDPGVRVIARVHQIALLAGSAALLWFALQWNLVGG